MITCCFKIVALKNFFWKKRKFTNPSQLFFSLDGWRCSVTLQMLFTYSVYFFGGPRQQIYFLKKKLCGHVEKFKRRRLV